jgi:hypothetical protein
MKKIMVGVTVLALGLFFSNPAFTNAHEVGHGPIIGVHQAIDVGPEPISKIVD